MQNPTELDERVENFLDLFTKTLGELTEEEFKVGRFFHDNLAA